ncbi:hypothetical protein ACOI1C_21355 [Bacillus sp. DJP31]
MAKEVNLIEDVFEGQFVMEKADPFDQRDMGHSYLNYSIYKEMILTT